MSRTRIRFPGAFAPESLRVSDVCNFFTLLADKQRKRTKPKLNNVARVKKQIFGFGGTRNQITEPCCNRTEPSQTHISCQKDKKKGLRNDILYTKIIIVWLIIYLVMNFYWLSLLTESSRIKHG